MNRFYPTIFSPASLGTLDLKNRLVRSATFEALADDTGSVTDAYLDLHRRLARGGVGLIVTGYACPRKDGMLPHMIDIGEGRPLAELSAVASAVHEAGEGCKIALQIGHCGRQLPAHGVPRQTLAPSAVCEPVTGRMPIEMTEREIESFIDDCAAAIGRAKEAGFDAVQLHSAHGWLISSFLSPHTNRRSDAYGGSPEKRARIMTEIIRRARERAGKDYPVFAKVNATDYIEGGLGLPDALELGTILEAAGFVALEISSCMWETSQRSPAAIGWKAVMLPESRTNIRSVADEAYHRPFARAFKERLRKAKIILVGGLRSPGLIEEILGCGDADFIALSRPLVREPELPRRWEMGSKEKSACISCNSCVKELRCGGLKCARLES